MNNLKKKILIGLLLGLPALLPIVVSQFKEDNPNPIQMYDDTPSMTQEIERRIPVGTNIKKAKIIMEQNGFGCALEVDSKYRRNLSIEQAEKSGKRTRLLCFKQTGWLLGKAWTVQLDFKKSKVTGYDSFYRQISPEI